MMLRNRLYYFAVTAVYFAEKKPYNRTNKFEQRKQKDPKAFSHEISPNFISNVRFI